MLVEGNRGSSPQLNPWDLLPMRQPQRRGPSFNPSYVPPQVSASGGGGYSPGPAPVLPQEQVSGAINFLKANLDFNIAADDVQSRVKAMSRAKSLPSGAAAVGPKIGNRKSSVNPWDEGLSGFLPNGKKGPKINITQDRVQNIAVTDPTTGMSIPIGRRQSLEMLDAQRSGKSFTPNLQQRRRPFLRGLNNFMLPVEGMSYEDMVGDFGPRVHPVHGGYSNHTGVDYGAALGTPIYAPSNAIVNSLNPNAGAYGNQVILEHGRDLQTMYGHLSSFAPLTPGSKVRKGDLLGYIGSTGLSTGPHLHWETWRDGSPFNPIEIMGGS